MLTFANMKHSSIDAPIGYAGAPFMSRAGQRRLDMKDHKEASGMKPEDDRDEDSSFSLLALPQELILHTFSFMSQYDTAKLAPLSEGLCEIARKKLYRNIVIDSNFSQFEEQYDVRCNSYINSRYGLRKFFEHIITNDYLASCVKTLTYRGNTSRTDDEMLEVQLANTFLKQAMPLCMNLESLDWFHSQAVDFGVLKRLGAPQKLRKLALNMSFGSLGILEFINADLGLKNLESLSIKPFHSSTMLANILLILLRNSDLSKLKSLRCVKHDTLTDLLKSPAATLPLTEESQLDLDTILVLCFTLRHMHKSKDKLRLEHFCLKSCILRPTDYEILNNTIELRSLKGLYLEEMTAMDSTNPNPIIPNAPSLGGSFLDLLSPSLTSIKCLNIDVRQTNIDSVPNLIRNLENLHELDLAIRWNDSKLQSYHSRTALCLEYAEAISNHCKTLRKLAIESSHEVSPYKRALIGIPTEMFESLFLAAGSVYPLLKSLRLNVSSGSIVQNREVLFRRSLPNLQNLWVFGQEAGGRPHMGLQNPFPGVFDEWLMVQHVVYHICDNVAMQKCLKYVKIDKCLFEVTYTDEGHIEEVYYKDKLDTWFDEVTRVQMK